jgi:hypothetical protein
MRASSVHFQSQHQPKKKAHSLCSVDGTEDLEGIIDASRLNAARGASVTL